MSDDLTMHPLYTLQSTASKISELEAKLDKATNALRNIRKNEGGSLTLYAHAKIEEGLGEIHEEDGDDEGHDNK